MIIRESQCLLTKYETPFIPGVDTGGVVLVTYDCA